MSEHLTAIPEAGAGSLSRLSDDAFEKVVIANSFPRTRDEDTYERLQSRALIQRTRLTLLHILERHLVAVRARSSRRFSVCDDPEQRLRDANFTATIQLTITETNAVQKQYHRQDGVNEDRRRCLIYRAVIGELVRAVQQHRDACIDIYDEPADTELWSVLDTVTAPNSGEWVAVSEFAGLPAPRRPPFGEENHDE